MCCVILYNACFFFIDVVVQFLSRAYAKYADCNSNMCCTSVVRTKLEVKLENNHSTNQPCFGFVPLIKSYTSRMRTAPLWFV